MAYLDDVEACFDAKVAAYAKNKRTGGSSGKKGCRFEDFYAVFCIAKHAVEHINNATPWPTIQEQADALVDDLVLTWPNANHFHQLKNVIDVGWQNGTHPIATDFEYQNTFAAYKNLAGPKTILVVSTSDLKKKLDASMPKAIQHHTTVEQFPYYGTSYNSLVMQCGPLRDVLSKLTRVPNPTDDELGIVFGILLMGFLRYEGNIDAEAVYQAGKSVSPHLLRILPSEMQAFQWLDGVQQSLANIPGLSYGTERGFFWWEAFGTSGVLSYNIMSKEFGDLQTKLVQHGPFASFDDFEELVA